VGVLKKAEIIAGHIKENDAVPTPLAPKSPDQGIKARQALAGVREYRCDARFMISLAFIKEWSHVAPWRQMYQVEQDLIISRALVELFNRPLLAENLAFHGGSTLFMLYLAPVRYSEDLDLVQVRPGPIK